MKTAFEYILLISPEAWGKNRLSKHHYASFLAENHQVIFLNPAIGFSKIPFGKMEIKREEVAHNFTVITYKNILPRLNHWPLFVRRFAYKIQAKRIVKFLGQSPGLVWSFDPRRFSDQRVWNSGRAIYHSVDLHPGSSEKEMVQHSDLVVGLSDLICDDLKKLGAHPFQTGHGCHVDSANTASLTLPGENKLKAIYTGNFHQHVDYGLLIQLAAENANCDFILVGPVEPSNISSKTLNQEDLQKLKRQKNVFLAGSVSGDELPAYLNAADICLVLFKKEFEDVHHAPHKMMAYFASGKVILANHMSGYQGLSEDLVIITPQVDIPKRFSEILMNLYVFNAPEKMQLRRNYAAANHYRIKIRQILGKLLS